MSVAALLDRLESVSQRAPGRWVAKCPAHTDRSPSLSLRELDDGTVLVKCFAGCGAADVLEAVGLDFGILFPGKPEPRASSRPNHWHVLRDAARVLHHEVLIVALAADNIAQGIVLTSEDVTRISLASGRIRSALEACL